MRKGTYSLAVQYEFVWCPVEFYGDIPLNASGTPANSFDTGFTYLIRDNLQFDIAGGIGLSDDADDWFVGAGVSYRFPQ